MPRCSFCSSESLGSTALHGSIERATIVTVYEGTHPLLLLLRRGLLRDALRQPGRLVLLLVLAVPVDPVACTHHRRQALVHAASSLWEDGAQQARHSHTLPLSNLGCPEVPRHWPAVPANPAVGRARHQHEGWLHHDGSTSLVSSCSGRVPGPACSELRLTRRTLHVVHVAQSHLSDSNFYLTLTLTHLCGWRCGRSRRPRAPAAAGAPCTTARRAAGCGTRCTPRLRAARRQLGRYC